MKLIRSRETGRILYQGVSRGNCMEDDGVYGV